MHFHKVFLTKINYTACKQTVYADTKSKYHDVISKFKEKIGCPIELNTSFNVRGEPIICIPTDPFKCFTVVEIDVLTVLNFVLYKEQQDKAVKENYD